MVLTNFSPLLIASCREPNQRSLESICQQQHCIASGHLLNHLLCVYNSHEAREHNITYLNVAPTFTFLWLNSLSCIAHQYLEYVSTAGDICTGSHGMAWLFVKW